MNPHYSSVKSKSAMYRPTSPALTMISSVSSAASTFIPTPPTPKSSTLSIPNPIWSNSQKVEDHNSGGSSSGVFMAGTQPYEQLLSNSQQQGMLPILLYIRNFNEYRRHKPAEARLAARRQARAEAREIRLRDMERQQKEMEQTSDRHYDILNSGSTTVNNNDFHGITAQNVSSVPHHRSNSINSNNIISIKSTPILTRERSSSYANSRRSSQESLNDGLVNGVNNGDIARELRHQVHELEEKFRKAMINNAQLDNEKQSFVYRIDLFKDELEELEENYIRLQRDYKDKSKNFDLTKRDYDKLKHDFGCYKDALEERDRLLQEAGLVLIRNEDQKIQLCSQKSVQNGMLNGDCGKNESKSKLTNSSAAKMVNGNCNGDGGGDVDEDVDEQTGDLAKLPLELCNSISLISRQASDMISDIDGDTLEVKLKRLLSDRYQLQQNVKDLNVELVEERHRYNELNDSVANSSIHLTTEMQAEIQREANKLTNDYRYKLKKAEQEIVSLSTNVSRLETQVARCKVAAEESERLEDELKSDKRKAQRELRDAQIRIDELESANAHLQKRIDKLKSNRNLLGGISIPTTPTPNSSAPTTPPIVDKSNANTPIPMTNNNNNNNNNNNVSPLAIQTNGNGIVGNGNGTSSGSCSPCSSSTVTDTSTSNSFE